MNPFLVASGLALRIDTGFPWTRAQITQGFGKRGAFIGLYETASFTRHQLAGGLSYRWLDKGWAIDTDLLVGATLQGGPNPQKGTSAETRIKIQKNKGRIQPWLNLGVRPTLLVNQFDIDASDGPRTEYSVDYKLSYSAGLGLDWRSPKGWGIGLGFDLPQIDTPSISIPGLHLSVSWGERVR